MITGGSSNVHWTYFIALEQDVEVLARFIEPTKHNFETYSIELSRILFAACSEFEVVLKQLSQLLGVPSQKSDITQLRTTLTQRYPEMADEKVYIRRYGLTLDPLDNWRDGKGADWWRSYNQVKHHRVSHFPEANVRNTLNAVAALLVATVHYYRIEFSSPNAPPMDIADLTMEKLAPESRLFFLGEDRYHEKLYV